MNKLILNFALFSAVAVSGASVNSYADDPDVFNADGSVAEARKPPTDVPVVDIKPDFKVIADLPVVPGDLPVYRVIPVDPQKINPSRDALGRIFEFKPEKSGSDKAGDGTVSVMYTDGQNRSLEYFSSGAVFYMEEQLFDERADDYLKKLGADRNGAKKQLSREAMGFMKQNGLMQDNMKFNGVSFMDVSAISVKSRRESNKVVGAAAHFGYELNGIAAWGPGAKTTLYYGENGITGYYDAMPAMKAEGQAKTVDPEIALKQYVEAGKAQTLYRLYSGAVEQVVIEKIELVYYVDAGNRTQKTVEPHYLISGTFYGQDLSGNGAGSTENRFVWLQNAVEGAMN